MKEWIISNNIKKFDVVGAFEQSNELFWRQRNNIEAGDVVYIYVSNPVGALGYKCEAIEVDMTLEEVNAEIEKDEAKDDSEFSREDEDVSNIDKWMSLRLVENLEKYREKLNLDSLKKHGLRQFQGASKVKPELSAYIRSVIGEVSVGVKDVGANLEAEKFKAEKFEAEADDRLIEALRDEDFSVLPDFKYNGKPKPKGVPVDSKGHKTYARDKQVAMNALAHANYECEMDAAHPTFLRKKLDVKYTEPHHLVPMAFSDKFENSLDVEENIISLCSNCHNHIHYGKGADELVKKLYNERKDVLAKAGVEISLTKLLEMYGY